MANMNFGVNILPKVNNTYSLGNSDKKWNLYVNEINGTALSSLIPDVSGFYTKPSGGIPASDLAETYLTDDTTWNGVKLNKLATTSSSDIYVISNSSTAMTSKSYLTRATETPTANTISKYDTNAYLNSTTPSSGDNSTKVATTAFVQTAISGLGSGGGSGLPSVSSTDNGKILQVSSGAWSIVTPNFLTSHQDISGKANSADLATVATTGSYNDLLNKPDLSSYLTSVPTMTGATSSAAGTTGLVPAPTSADVDKFLAGDGTYKSGGLPMVILSYGSSTWADFEAAYNNNVIVYARASSNSNPASGSQTRMAFMAYVNNATTPTEVEFQYYRSMNAHSATAMGDQVFVYKLNKTNGWSVTTRDASIKQITGSGITVAWSSNKVTLTNDVTVSDSLTDTSTTKALSAAKGKELADQIGSLQQMNFTLNHGASKTITFSAGCWCLFFSLYGTAATVSGAWYINGSASNPTSIAIKTPTQFTVTDGSSGITVTNNHSSADVPCTLIILSGSSTVTIS